MIKFISKYLAKKYIKKHKDDGTLLGVTNNIIKSIDVYEDLVIYTVIYILCTVLVIIGVPIGTYFLMIGHNPALWSLLSFILSGVIMARLFVIMIASILKDVYNIILDVKKYPIMNTKGGDKTMIWSDGTISVQPLDRPTGSLFYEPSHLDDKNKEK